MSVQHIIKHLNKLIELHDSLLHLSEHKTELLKSNKMEELQKLLVTEQKHVQAINQIEKRRIDAVAEWAVAHQLEPAAVHVTAIIEHYTTGADQEQLQEVTLQLAERLVALRRQEELNKQLTKQSLQFVQLTLDMIQPSIRNINYGQSKQAQAQTSKRSVFDSKA
ncbi:flagellar protein FlgN [Gracilibacillus caseinilyticus]|uniref:Flagellar protein FlgN n=1 Tax=Gracilibacillus caseinilyticus TaxID=2932256 RepID=A0ABY4EV77_9BACI|nr:flagellar protein FlgN [Gracilibacillus caseinilyticus]UOQ48309.1 flagellar protein FlgN [Gracilibacillus caseinilyticus]